MRLFDTHCHFERADEREIAEQLERARAAGVERVMAVGGSPALNASAAVAGRFGCLVAQGWDRDQASEPFAAVAPECGETAANAQDGGEIAVDAQDSGEIAAVGEIGLDYHYSPETRAAQLALFGRELERARRLGLPVVIHTRDADDDTLGLLREIPSRGIIHCFTGTPDFARKLLDLGFYVSISGIVTFKSAANVRESALIVPDDRILIETDSPYLAPAPMRGKANEPAFLRHTCEFLATLRGVSAESFADLTFRNALAVLASR